MRVFTLLKMRFVLLEFEQCGSFGVISDRFLTVCFSGGAQGCSRCSRCSPRLGSAPLRLEQTFLCLLLPGWSGAEPRLSSPLLRCLLSARRINLAFVCRLRRPESQTPPAPPNTTTGSTSSEVSELGVRDAETAAPPPSHREPVPGWLWCC